MPANELSRSASLSPALRRRQLEDGLVLAAGGFVAFCAFEPRVALLVAAWWFVTLVIVRSDIADQLIPDWTSGAIVLLALLRLLTMHGFTGAAFGLIGEAVLRAAATSGLLWTIGWAYERISGHEGLGFGDVKLAGAIAFWLGPYELLLAFELATFAALALVAAYRLIRRTEVLGSAIPFGAFLAPAAWIILVSAPIAERFWPWPAIPG
ncbi:MAG TPA: A24 family peptidase [Methylovirgula sp.]|nr:A24 family peptidase [Methylovirgula sp.]